MLNAIFRPVVSWPGNPTPDYERRRAPFRVPYLKRLDLLEFELDKLAAENVIIQAYFDQKEIRNDGWPRSSARPKQPGVILTFDVKTLKNGESVYSYPCDTYNSWEDNLYAIALSLEALRAVNRYGVTKRGEQYQGFKCIEAPKETDPFEWISDQIGIPVTKDNLKEAYKLAVNKLHPDNIGGNHGMFVKLQDQYRLAKESAK